MAQHALPAAHISGLDLVRQPSTLRCRGYLLLVRVPSPASNASPDARGNLLPIAHPRANAVGDQAGEHEQHDVKNEAEREDDVRCAEQSPQAASNLQESSP